ncbi:helix-turn-helix transcriptional regulator [Lacticaseibacillus sharpeae]|uniref:helix-turn-helix transcriptional regulator n=1 Tax=Lacticaseibacillus sharpeae TaxID=1626 RepID=UPI000704BF00|nr:hypothetical protein [Lacticaseibacillus sharpeae]
MPLGTTKEELRVQFLKPKTKLLGERSQRKWTTQYAADLIGVSRRQYELKERGAYPFNDYEMYILAKKMGLKVGSLFFED